MNLRIKTSVKMSQDKSPLGNIEDRLIRIPKEVRDKIGKEIGLFLCLKTKNGSSIPLQITNAYKADVDIDPNVAYVSDETYTILDLNAINALNPAKEILLGCDPEFFIVDSHTNRNISASHFFSSHGEIGSDVGLAELRPRPHLTPLELTNCMHDLLKNAYKHLTKRVLYNKRPIRMVAASMHDNASAGFHVHFGMPPILLNQSYTSRNLLSKIVCVLDYYVGISAILPEGEEDYQRRSKRYSQYGKPGDFRDESKITLEYRVPGGHLLRHPKLTLGLLSLCNIVIHDMLSRLKVYTNNFSRAGVLKKYDELRDLYPNIPDRANVYNTITNEKIGSAVHHVDKIYKDLSMMVGFEKHKQHIVNYFSYVINYLSNGEKYTDSIAHNWRLMHHEG